ncbi:MAG: hypothetical protein AUH45_02395 [Gemmatimonadetes bacterium 13_1_40CM_69_22]|nr:MAG: hypothetical protein AUH45_02395 [Gemmatimonadetes bacterium 13_1_40CM_69_22]
MRRAINERIARGAVGGLLAGLTVALWFLVVDSLAGRPFHTPAVLAGALARQDIAAPTFRIVAAYTVVHFAVFALLGVAMAAAIGTLRLPPRLLLAVPFGLVAQELVFYAGLLLSGTPRVAVVPWPHVVLANVLSGCVLMWYLHRAQPDEGALGLAALKGHPLLARGLVTGLIGAGVVAVWFFLLDVAAGHPLRTPAALGAALLFGASNVGEIQPNLGVVAAYTVVHVAAFAVTGTLFVAVAEQIERAPAFVLLAGMAAIVLEAVAVAALALGAQWVLGTLGTWSVLVANVLAVTAMGWYVWETHPLLRHRLTHETIRVHT